MGATLTPQRVEWTEEAIDHFLCTDELGCQAIDLPLGRRTLGFGGWTCVILRLDRTWQVKAFSMSGATLATSA